MDIETELQDLKRRVGELEGTVSMLSSRLDTIQPGLESLQRQTAEQFQSVETMFTRLIGRIDTLNTQVWSLRDDLPAVIHQAIKPSDPNQPD